MSEFTKYRQYLNDLGLMIKQFALNVRDMAESSEGETLVFLRGQLSAYAEVISLMQQEAAVFGIGPEELQLDDIQPFEDLIGGVDSTR